MKKKKNLFGIIFLALFFTSAIGLGIWQQILPTRYITLAGDELYVQVAKYPHHQYRGLGGRDSLGAYDGMLFTYTYPDQHGIVMRDMRFSIDIIWLNGDTVVDIAKNVPIEPGREESELTPYWPRVKATNVLEVAAGWSDSVGLKIGDRAQIINK